MDIFLLHFLLHFTSLFIPSASYKLPDNYFVNCGSSSSPSINGRIYTGDLKPAGKFSLTARGSHPVAEHTSPSDIEIYQTARIFRKPSFYEFAISNNTPYYTVRFHFYSSPAVGNLPDARFSVSASGFWLLSNFTVPGDSFPLVRDFFLLIQSEKLRIDFVPAGGGPCFAFVNAIEVFNTPFNFSNSPLRVIHRINVGGPNVTPTNDTLLRYWVPDDAYLVSKNAAVNRSLNGVPLNFQDQFTDSDAPESVYQTARTTNISNITWSFAVKKETDHLVRVHFCDIVTQTTTEQNWFRLYNRSYGFDIWPFNFNSAAQSPFHIDYLFHSDDLGFLNVTVGPNTTSPNSTAFLNGVEIMEIVTEASSYSFGASESKIKVLLIIIGSVIGALILVAFVAFCFIKRKQRLADDFDWVLAPFHGGSSSHSKTTIRTLSDSPLNLGLKFTFSEIIYATKRFNPKMMIGQGGFGKVYKGILTDGTKIAVKRSEPGLSQGISEFETEVILLSKIRHNHLVSLIGYCDERDEMILVYEFMEKGTLREHLYISSGEGSVSRSDKANLSWEERLRICIGAAKGLNYLHTGSSGSTIIHRDIKSTNILLDEKLVAKVADFGISRSIELDETHMSTDVKGSFGYLDPEYFKCMQLTLKSDVYSFGVVLLEVLCARAVIDVSLPMEQVNLPDWAMRWQRNGELGTIIDPLLVGRVHPDSLRKFGETVERCLQEEGSNRPNMVDVLWDLEYCLRLQGTALPREPHEDSATDVSWGLNLPAIGRLPSNSIEVDDDVLRGDSYGFSGVSRDEAGEVFSQLKVDEAR